MALSEQFLEELKRRNDIRSVVSSYITIKGTGKNPKGLCPFHNEKTPSFTLYTDSDSFYCFGCGAGGDAIRFIMLMENLSYIEAVKLLCERSGMELPQDGADDSFFKLKNTVLSINRETARFFYNYMMSAQGREGYKYFKDRQLSDNTIRHFGLGFAPDSWDALTKHLRSAGFSDADMITANVVSRGKNNSVYDRFRHRAMFPVIDLRGNVIAFSGRKMPGDDSNAKYVNTSDTPVYKKSYNLFALNFAKDHCKQNMILCEGQMDAIALHQAGFFNAVAPLGTSFTNEQAQLISQYTGEVLITMDADAAGQKATDKAINILNRAGVEVKIIRIPDGKDPDEFLKTYGAEGPDRFRALIDGAGNDVEYRLFMASSGIDTATDDGRVRYLQKAAEILADIPSQIERDVYAGRLAEKYSVAKSAVLSQTERVYRKKRASAVKKEAKSAVALPYRDDINPERNVNLRAANAEEAIISLILKNPDYIDRSSGRLHADIFITSFNKKVFSVLENRVKQGKSLSLTLLSGEFTPEELGKIAAIQAREDFRANTIAELSRCIAVLEEENAKKTIAERSSGDDSDFLAAMKQIKGTKRKGSK